MATQNRTGRGTTQKHAEEHAEENDLPMGVAEETLDDDFYGDASDRSEIDGGITVKAVKIPEGRSITGLFRGFLPFEYEDKQEKDPKKRHRILNFVILDIINPVTGEHPGVIAKVTGTARIINDLAPAFPGDKVRIARLGQIEIGKHRLWDDVITIWPAQEGRGMQLSQRPVTDRKGYDAFQTEQAKALGGYAPDRTLGAADFDAEQVAAADAAKAAAEKQRK